MRRCPKCRHKIYQDMAAVACVALKCTNKACDWIFRVAA